MTMITQSLVHGLNMLLLYNRSPARFTVTEISKLLGYSQSKSYRLVRTLVKLNFLQQNRGTAQYSLGVNILSLGLLAQKQFNIHEIARPFMKKLSLITKETVLVTAVNGTKGVVLEKIESEEPIRYSSYEFESNIPLHCGASSKILMAYLPEDEWDRIIKKEGLKRYTPNTITKVNQLKANLREIRKKGYASSYQEVNRGVRAVAAPILDRRGELVAGLSVAGPAFRFNKKAKLFLKLVLQYARKISKQIGSSIEP